MNETKTTYIMPDGFDGNNNQLWPMMAMMGNGGFGANGMWNNPFVYLVWMMFAQRMWNNNGWGDNGNFAGQPAQNIEIQSQLSAIREQLSDNQSTQLLMDAIKGNQAALGQLASSLNCDFGVLKDCCCNIQQAIATVGGQVGFSAERVINAANQGDYRVIEALKDCCCTTEKLIIEQGYQNQLANERQTYQLTNSINTVNNSVERGFCDTAFATKTQTCDLQNTIRDTSNASTTQIIAKLDAMQNQALLDKIDALREKNSQQAVVINNAQQSAAISQMIGAATAPIANAVNALQSDVNGIKCKLPETVTLPYNCATAVPTSMLYNNWSLNYNGGWNNWSNWNNGCCNNSLWG